MSKITDAERERRAMLAERDTPQVLAGLLFVAEKVAHGMTVSTWTLPNGKVMDLREREEIVKKAILEMQIREIEGEGEEDDELSAED